ncbi:MAG: ABC transporter permease [Bacteroidota bacterium]
MKNPPKWLLTIFRHCIPESRPDLEGDFLELYEQESGLSNGTLRNLKWLLRAFRFIPLKIIMSKNNNSMRRNNINMLSLYFKIGRRNLVKNKTYSIINLCGLTIAFAACILIALFVIDEFSYDKHFKDYEKIYRLAGKYDSGGDEKTVSAMSSYMLKPFIKDQFNNIDKITRLDFTSAIVELDNQKFMEESIAIVDSNFFDVFQFHLIRGNFQSLHGPNSVAISEKDAAKYFGNEDPMGKTLEINDRSFSVTAIIADQNKNAHFESGIFLPMHGVLDWYPDWVMTNFSGYGMYTYIKTFSPLNEETFDQQLNQYVVDQWDTDSHPQYFVQSLPMIHLNSNINHEISDNGSMMVIYIFSVTAIIILLLASINYINLSLAGSFQRSKEVGMKKVFGASKKSQVTQFQLESVMMIFTSAVFALALAYWLLPFLNTLTDKSLTLDFFSEPMLLLAYLGLTIFISLITGSFPAVFLLKIPTLSSLKGNILNRRQSSFSIRSMLITAQFFISVMLLVSTMAIINQINFLRNKDLGIKPDEVVLVPFQTAEMTEKYEVMKNELLQNSEILSVTASNSNITNRIGGWRSYRIKGRKEQQQCPTVIIKHDFFKTIGAEFVAGRDFNLDYPSDKTQAYIINESAARFFNFDSTVVGQSIAGGAFTGSKWTIKDAKIIGVVKDFHFASLHDKVRPVVFSLHSEITTGLAWMEIKIAEKDKPKTISLIESVWNKHSGDTPFSFDYMAKVIADHYEEEDNFLQVFSIFSFLSIFIGCLGLFGITAFVMKRRSKEIGIRKVLGAKAQSLIVLLSKDFLKLILISNVLGFPFAYLFISEWIQNFAYQAPISHWIFVITCIGLLSIALITILFHTIKTVQANPVKAIKYE